MFPTLSVLYCEVYEYFTVYAQRLIT